MEITKNGIPYIDISGVNCWIAYLMPYNSNDRKNYEEVSRFQNECIEKKIFGMGWNVTNFLPSDKADECGRFFISDDNNYTDLFKNIEKSEENAEISEEDNKQEKEHPAVKAYNNYANIHPGDYVIFRSKESHYYIGKVTTNAYYRVNEDEKDLLAWRCKVEKWVEYKTQEEIASEIVGRFSQRQHKTIDRICDYRLKLSVIAAYENGKDTEGNPINENERVYNIPKIKIDKNNFVSCLNYTELEDVVYVYINSLHRDEGYRLYPSSCKVNHQKYEYTFFHKTKDPISCQVKNHEKIDAEIYEKEAKKYEKIYLFSGYAFSEETINKFKGSNIVIINQSDLFAALDEYLDHRNLSSFYEYKKDAPNNLEKLDLNKFTETKRWSSKYEIRLTQCKKTDQYVYFYDDAIFYSEEFDALIFNSKEKEQFKKEFEYVKENLKYK